MKAMTTPDFVFENTFHIHTFECDINRQWKPAAFFQHLTETAGNHAEHLGCGFDVMFARNLFWVHSRMKIKFFRFPLAGEQITIRTWPKTIQQKLFFIRDYEILDADGKQLAAASSAWLVINATTRRMVPPQSLDLNLPALTERIGLDEPLEKLAVTTEGQEKLRVRAGYSAVDLLGHVNNSRYVEWICDTFPMEKHCAHRLDWMQINYDREIRPGEEVALLAHESPETAGLWRIEGRNCTNNTHAFEAEMKWKE